MLVRLDDGRAFSDPVELGLRQTIDFAEHRSKKSQLAAQAVRIDAIDRVSNELSAGGEHQFLSRPAQ